MSFLQIKYPIVKHDCIKPIPLNKEVVYELDEEIFAAISWDKETEQVEVKVEMPTDGYLAFAFGSHTKASDLVIFKSYLEQPIVDDCFLDENLSSFVDK